VFKRRVTESSAPRLPAILQGVALLILLSFIAACGGSSDSKVSPTAAPANTQQPAATASPQAAVPKDLKLVKVTPDNGSAGTAFTITGDGLPADKDAEVFWATVDGSWDTTATPENIQFNKRVYKDKRISLGKVHIDASGKLSGTAKAPDDFGEVHDLYLAVGGEDVAKSGFRIMRKVTISPESGPIGTPISIKVTGLSWAQYTSVISIRYDNQPLGIITGVETRGSATGLIRASGPAGNHVIDVDHGARSVPFLNNQQSGTANIPDWRFTFKVTDDKTMPPVVVEWPDTARVAKISSAAPTASSGKPPAGNAKAQLTPDSGTILSSTAFSASGLTAGTEYELFWVTARGNRTSPTGWSLSETSVGKKAAGADGSVKLDLQIPDDLGGWHVIKVAGAGAIVAEVPYFVERSLLGAGVTPQKVKAGDPFQIHLKGIGWTELDNGVAITYDNGYIGFACGFNSNGDVTVNLVATGSPGIHLIDIYPMIYQGHGESPWGYQQPLLAFKEDAPGLALGYRLPTFRLAIEITP
jgi:hypothetical protein